MKKRPQIIHNIKMKTCGINTNKIDFGVYVLHGGYD